jgi:transposase
MYVFSDIIIYNAKIVKCTKENNNRSYNNMKTSTDNTGIEPIGGIPLIASYLNKINIIDSIDKFVKPLRSNNRRYSHSKTCFVLILYLMFRPHVMYKLEDWVRDTTYLRVIFPDIKSEYFNDDRTGDTLDALYKANVCNIFTQQSINITEAFNLEIKETNADFSNFSVYGDFESDEGIKITYGGAPKSKRTDLRQFAIDVAVEATDGVPIYQKVSDGNSADVAKYPSVWKGIKECLGNSNFVIIGDCKLSSESNLLKICNGEGYYISPLAMYKSVKDDLRNLVIKENIEHELIREDKKGEETIKKYIGFETNGSIVDSKKNKVFYQRKIYVHSSQLKKTELETLERRINMTNKALNTIANKINTKKYNSEEKIVECIRSTLSKYKIDKSLLKYKLGKTTEIVKKKIGKGKIGKNTKFEEVTIDSYNIEFNWDKTLVEEEKKLCGYFVIVTNKTSKELSKQEVFQLYKKQWKIEKIFEKLKGPLQVLPIRLKLPTRIESLMYLLMTCAQVFTLIDREARISLEKANEEIVGLSANNIALSRPRTESMLEAVRNIGLVYKLEDGEFSVKINGLNGLIDKIFNITKIDPKFIEDKYICSRLDVAEKLDKEALYGDIMYKFSNKSN